MYITFSTTFAAKPFPDDSILILQKVPYNIFIESVVDMDIHRFIAWGYGANLMGTRSEAILRDRWNGGTGATYFLEGCLFLDMKSTNKEELRVFLLVFEH